MTAPPIRQGDVLLVPRDNIPPGLSEVQRDDRGRIVLMHGEVTGHAHVIEDPAATFYAADVAEMEDRFLLVEREVLVTHEEHDALVVPPGVYEVRRQREYAPESERYVAD